MRRPSKMFVGSMTRSSITGSMPSSSVKGSADSRVRCRGEEMRAPIGPAEPVHVLCGLLGHAASVCAQPVPREPPVEHAAGVVNLSVAHEMKAVGGHLPSLRGVR